MRNIIAVVVLMVSQAIYGGDDSIPNRIQSLIDDASSQICAMESKLLKETLQKDLTKEEIAAAIKWLNANPDFRSLFVLLALKKTSIDNYQMLPVSIKGKVLVSSLQKMTFLNDWGSLEPNGCREAAMAKCLIELGSDILTILFPVLNDTNEAPLFGSEDATISHIYKYRRCDFAYRYVCLICKMSHKFLEDPKERDKLIVKLIQDKEAILKSSH